MYRKTLFNLAAFVVLCFSLSVVGANAQSVTGVVELDKSGARTPLAGAKVDLFRGDVIGKGQTITTGPDGKFSFAAVETGHTYLLSVSAPGASPNYIPNIASGMQDVLVTVIAGDGRSFNETELKQAIEKINSQMSAEDKKKQAEFDKQRLEITSKNRKAEQNNKLFATVIKDGGAALNQKKYTEAIALYDQGINADPDFEGSAPVFLNSKAVALKERGRTLIVDAQKGDAAARTAARQQATPDYALALASFDQGLAVIAKAPANTTSKSVMDESRKSIHHNYILALGDMYETSIPVPDGIDAAKILTGYIETESDATRRAAVLAKFGERAMGGDLEVSVMAFKKALETNPKDLDVLGGAALAMGSLGLSAEPPNKAMIEEAKRVAKSYLDSAPKDHPKYAGVVDIMENLNAVGS